MRHITALFLLSAALPTSGCKSAGANGSMTESATVSKMPYCTNGSNTGNGYGWDTSVTDPSGSHSCLVPPAGSAQAQSSSSGASVASNAQTTVTNSSSSNGSNGSNNGGNSGGNNSSSASLQPLSVHANGDYPFSITTVGSQLQNNKINLGRVAAAAGATPQQVAIIIAMAMQETTLMETYQRDSSKDGTMSANCSLLNLNYDMLQRVGYNRNDYGAYLNDPNNLGEAIKYLLLAFSAYGLESTFNYQRGGYTSWQDGVSYGAYDYRNAVESIYNQIVNDPTLETDGRRVATSLQHV